MLAIGFQLVPPSVDDSHSNTLVKVPVRVNVPVLVPLQTEALALIVAEEGASTVTMAGEEKAETLGGEGSSTTSALYQVVAVRFEYARLVLAELEILDHEAPLLVEDCHLTTFPDCPVNVKSPLLVPEQTVVFAPADPPTDWEKEIVELINNSAFKQTFFISEIIFDEGRK